MQVRQAVFPVGPNRLAGRSPGIKPPRGTGNTFARGSTRNSGAAPAAPAPNNVFVGSCGTPTYSKIQLAVNAVKAGGTVQVCPGTYVEQVTITKNLNLTGVVSGTLDAVVIASPATLTVNSYDTFNNAPIATQLFVQNANNVQIGNITVDGSGNNINSCLNDFRGIYYQNSSGQISDVVARNQTPPPAFAGCQSGQGIFVQSGYAAGPANQATVQIRNTTVRGFAKNGITVDGPGAQSKILNNYITGMGPTTEAAENGIQISDGAQATIQNNVVSGEIYSPDVFGDTGNAASGILIVGSQKVQIQNNIVNGTQFGIVTVTTSSFGTTVNPAGLADQTQISNNTVLNTLLYDAIDACSNNNQIQNNSISNSSESGVHLDSTCGTTGNNNHVSGNLIAEGCAGVLNGGTGNTVDNSNTYVGVLNTTSTGNVCQAPPSGGTGGTVVADAVTRGKVVREGRPVPIR